MNESLLQSTHVPGIDRLVAGAVVHSEAGVLIVRRSLSDDFLPVRRVVEQWWQQRPGGADS